MTFKNIIVFAVVFFGLVLSQPAPIPASSSYIEGGGEYINTPGNPYLGTSPVYYTFALYSPGIYTIQNSGNYLSAQVGGNGWNTGSVQNYNQFQITAVSGGFTIFSPYLNAYNGYGYMCAFSTPYGLYSPYYCTGPYTWGIIAATFFGCFADAGTRDLPYTVSIPSYVPVTVEYCRVSCGNLGYNYAGAQDGGQCFCGNSYGSYGTSTGCNLACSGNSTENCGGAWANAVYASITSSYQGCFVDESTRDLPYLVYSGVSTNTQENCAGLCAASGFSYAGVQAGSQCFCGNTYGRYGSTWISSCNYGCTGNLNEFCGGSWLNSVYYVRVV